jgi:hypothetical protein
MHTCLRYTHIRNGQMDPPQKSQGMLLAELMHAPGLQFAESQGKICCEYRNWVVYCGLRGATLRIGVVQMEWCDATREDY